MNPIETPVQKSPKKSREPRLVTLSKWVFRGIIVVFLFVTVIVVIGLHTTAFHKYALNKARSWASEQLGTQVELQSFTLDFAKLSVDIYGLAINGAAPYSNPPLLQIPHAQARVRIVSLLRGKWYLDALRVDGPVAKVFRDANGNTNLPKFKSAGQKSNTSVFDLGIRHATLTGGEVYYNDKHSSLAAEVHDLEFRALFDPGLQKYFGTLSYKDGHLTTQSTQNLPHSLNAAFDATPSVFHLAPSTISSGGSKLVLSATVQNYTDPDVQAQYDVIIDGRDVRRILANSSIPTGLIHTSGTAHYHSLSDHPATDALVLNGSLSSQQLDFQTLSVRTRINDIVAQYSLESGNATLQFLRGRLLNGVFEARGEMNAIGGNSSHTEVNVSLREVSLGDLRRTLRDIATPKDVALTGTLNSEIKANWGNTLQTLVAQADAKVDGRISGSSNGVANSIPLEAAIHGKYTNASEQIAVAQSYVRTSQTSLMMNGLMSKHSNLSLKLRANDLRELETVADLFQTSTPSHPIQSFGLAGSATFDGALAGSMTDPHLQGQLAASNLQIRETVLRVFRTDMDLSPSLAKFQRTVLEPASQGRISLDASVGLKKWVFMKTSPLQINLNGSELKLTDLTKITGKQIPVSGVLAIEADIHGSELHPAGKGNLSLTHLVAYNEPVRSAQVAFSGNGDEVHGNLDISLPAGNLKGTMSVRPEEEAYIAQVRTNNLRLEKLQTLKMRNVDANGGVTLEASGEGTFDNPQVDATVQIPELGIQNQSIHGIDLQMKLSDHIATANLVAQVINIPVRANAKVNLTDDYATDATVDTQAIPIQTLAAIYAPDQAGAINGETELHATLHGPLKNKKLLEAHLTIPVLKVGYRNVQLAAVSPIRVDFKDDVISVQRGAIRGTETDIEFQGSVPIAQNAPMSLLLVGTVNLRLAQLLDPDLISSGQLKFNINSYGLAHDPNVQGQIEIVDAGISTGDLPLGLQHGNGMLTLTRNRLNISRFQGTIGSGTVTAQGGVVYRPQLQFDLGLSAKDVRMLYPQGARESVNANIRLAGTPENAVLGGTVDLADLSFTPAFDLINFINQFSGGITSPPTGGISQNIQLNLAVRSSNNLALVSRTLSVNGRANLQVRGTAAEPVILGRINLDGGDLIFNGDRFILNGGTIQFVNPSETQPVVNLALNTTIQEYSINLRFSGPVDQLHTEYASDPSLPAADIINLLAFGKTTEANSANTATPANQQAASLVASQVSSQVTSRISKVAGISQLSIDPVLAGGSTQGPPGANITIQQRVTGNFFFTFSSNLASAQEQTIMGKYQLTPRIAVSATRDQSGGFGFDATMKKTW